MNRIAKLDDAASAPLSPALPSLLCQVLSLPSLRRSPPAAAQAGGTAAAQAWRTTAAQAGGTAAAQAGGTAAG